MKKIIYVCYILLPVLIWGCIERYDFEVEEVENLIVVDAELTDSLSTQEIKLSYQNAVTDQRFNGVSDATVVLEDNFGNEVTFVESSPGIYQAFFGANTQRSYRIKIDAPDGSVITSEFQNLPPPIKIDSIFFEETRESFVNADGRNRTQNVIKVFGSTNISNNAEDLFLRFGNLETVFLFQERKMASFPPPKTCYVYNKGLVPEIDVFEIKANSQDAEVKSLLFTKPINWELGQAFSARARLISMNRPHFEYWKEIEQVYSQNGNINNPPPARIRTNLSVENGPPVIGYFAMVRKSTSVLRITRADLDTPIVLRCGSIGGPFPFPYPSECGECLSISGATLERPPYWK